MKRILILCGAGLGGILILLAVLPFLIPSSAYKTHIEKAATGALGRDVNVAGTARISLFPTISASVNNVTVANPEGFESPYMIEAGALRGAVRIWPLLSRRVEISELSFEDASVNLLRRADGKVNWLIDQSASGGSEQVKRSGHPFSATIDRAGLRNATITYADKQADIRYVLSELDVEATVRDFRKPLSLRANGVFQTERFDFDATVTSPQSFLANAATSINVQLGSNLGNIGFEGTLNPEDPMEISGRFQANLPQLGAIPEFLRIGLPINLEPIGSLRARGSLAGSFSTLTVTFDELAVSGDGLNAKFDGSVGLGPSPDINGNFNLSLRDTYALSEQLGLGLEMLKPVRQVAFVSRISGPLSGLTFTGIDARTTSPVFNATYQGDISLKNDGSIKGAITANTTQLGAVLEQLGVGARNEDGIRAASVSGHMNGTFLSPGISEGEFRLGDTEATGSIYANVQGDAPRIEAELDMPVLDLTPFLGQSGDARPDEKGWSEAQLDLKALQLLDADLQIQAETVNIGEVDLKQASLDATLSAGRIDASLDQFIAFDGDWQGRVLIDASRDQPSFGFSLSSNGVQTSQLLEVLTNFDRLSGSGHFAAELQSNGTSIRQIVNQMDGQISLDIDDGALSGVNLGQLVRSATSLKDILSSGGGDMMARSNVISSKAHTDFSTFTSVMDVQDGVASIERLVLTNPVFSVSGAGQIDLGDRTLDMKLTPEIDRTGQGNTSAIQLNGIPVPLRIAGPWLSPKFLPDMSGLQSELSQGAANTLKKQFGGELGTILGNRGQTDSEADSDPQPVQENGEEQSATEKAVQDVIGSIFKPD